jgi:hypothetical protein
MKSSKTFAVALLVFCMGGSLRSQTPAETEANSLTIRDLSDQQRFSVSATATDTLLSVNLSIAPGWHMYGRETGQGPAVSLQVLDGSSFQPAGQAHLPMDEEGLIQGKVLITLPLRRAAVGDALQVRFSYMICDALQCDPPSEFILERANDVNKPLSILLVTSNDQDRRGRIQKFLHGQGFTCKAVDYDGVTKAACEEHDLVVYDSPGPDQETWRAVSRAGRQHAVAFPEVDTPIIAVGFLGTQLLEAHRIAIACGYI